MRRIKILLADDHPMVRTGLRLMLEQQNNFEFVVTEVANGKLALKQLLTNNYDIVLLDINLPHTDGLSIIKKAKEEKIKTPILVITMYNDEHIVKQAIESGASGYLLKNCGIEELSKAIETILDGENYYCSEASQSILIKNIRKVIPTQKEIILLNRLTEREKNVLKLIAEELTNIEIGEMLNISPRTVESHRARILAKLEVKNTVGLIRFSIKNGLLD